MDVPSSALLLHSSMGKDPLISLQGCSGISISKDWILTHGSALSPIMNRSRAISSFVENMKVGEVTLVPREHASELKFRVYLGIDDGSRSNDNSCIQESTGTVAAAWKCPLLKKTFDEFFETWSFPKSFEFARPLRSLFLLVRVSEPIGESIVDIPTVERALSCLLDRALRDPIRGSSTEIESTPFGNPVFIGSLARGVISNVVGDEGCVVMTDAYAFPGGEGGPVYVIPSSDCKRRTITGMVIAPVSWCRGEWVDYTFAANLAPCLLNVLRRMDPRYPAITDRAYNENEPLDRGVVLVRCGISWGTGVLVDKDTGIFLTCSHVVAEAPEREISIVMSTDNANSSAWAKLLYRTPDNQPYDVAVLRVNPQNLNPTMRSIRLSCTPIPKGEPVVSVGFPFSASARPTVSVGVVSKSTDCALLTTCCAQSGTSGGPIVSRATGEMLGMIVCNALSADGDVIYPRMSLAVPAAVLSGPLREHSLTDNPDALRAFTCDDPIVRKIWNFYPLLSSKL